MLTVCLLSVIVLLVIVKLINNAYDRPKNFPPGPPSLPVYGAYWIVLAFGWNNLSSAFTKLSKIYKSKILGLFLGPFPCVIISDAVLVKKMLFDVNFDGRMDTLLGRLRAYYKKLGIFFTDGEFWHVQRRFSLRYMRDFGFGRRSDALESVTQHDVKEMIDLRINGPKYPFEEEMVKGELISLPHYFAPPFINGMVAVFTQSSLDRRDHDALYRLAKGALLFQRSSDDLGRALVFTPWIVKWAPEWTGFNSLKKGNKEFLDFYTNLILQVMETQDDSHDRHFFDMYIRRMKKEMKQNGSSSFSVEQLALICTDYSFPPASCNPQVLTMLVERMLLSPRVQERVHEEIDRVVGRDRPVNLDDRQNMPYTEACLREMMRHETLVPLLIPHKAIRDTTFEGYDISEGVLVAGNLVSLHMSEEVWGDPEHFRPERFLQDGKLNLALDKSLPFGAGKRLCAGETYARQTMFQVFAGFMQAFQVSTADGKPLDKPYKRIPGIITTLPEFWVKVTPRHLN